MAALVEVQAKLLYQRVVQIRHVSFSLIQQMEGP